MAVTHGLFLYFIIALNIGWETVLERGCGSWFLGICRFSAALENNLFKIFAFFPSLLIIFSSSTYVIF